MTASARRWWLGLALLAVAAAYFAPTSDGGLDMPDRVRRAVPAQTTSIAPATTPREALELRVVALRPREESVDRESGVFGTPVLPPPDAPNAVAPVAVVEAPGAPEPPPVALKVIGRFSEAGRPGVFLEYREQNLVAHAGDTVGGLYRIDSIQEGRMIVRYLPMNREQTVDLSGQPN